MIVDGVGSNGYIDKEVMACVCAEASDCLEGDSQALETEEIGKWAGHLLTEAVDR